MSSRTIRLHRVLRANPERVYRAFLDADAMAKWLPPYGFTCKVHHMDATVGGSPGIVNPTPRQRRIKRRIDHAHRESSNDAPTAQCAVL